MVVVVAVVVVAVVAVVVLRSEVEAVPVVVMPVELCAGVRQPAERHRHLAQLVRVVLV